MRGMGGAEEGAGRGGSVAPWCVRVVSVCACLGCLYRALHARRPVGRYDLLLGLLQKVGR